MSLILTSCASRFPSSDRPRLLRLIAAALALVFAIACSRVTEARESRIDTLASRLSESSLSLIGSDGAPIAVLRRGDAEPQPIEESAVVAEIAASRLTSSEAATLWSILSKPSNAGLLTLPIVRAIAAATATPEAREVMWDTLLELASAKPRGSFGRNPLLGFFERHRDQLLPLLGGVDETEGAGNAMVDLMTESRLFGNAVEDGVRWIGPRHPGALARRIQRERDLGRPVKWEYAGFEQLLRWKDRHLAAGAAEPPATLAALDKAADTFALLFNSLYGLDERFRQQMLRGLSPADAFDIVIGGEAELYRMGTSSFRKHLHPMVMRGIAERGAFETFLERTAAERLRGDQPGASGRRGMVYLRVASAFGLLEPVLATIRNEQAFIEKALDQLGDASSFESNASVLLDILTARSQGAAAANFRRQLLDRLYGHYDRETETSRKNIYGSLLSVYQSMTGDHRDPGIDRDFPLDRGLLHTPFDALFSSAPGGEHIHRMFMRFDQDIDGASNFGSFRALMSQRGAEVHTAPEFEVYRIRKSRRSIEIYVNRPSGAGMRKGIDALSRVLGGLSVHTVIGRGHSGIIAPLRKDSERLLGPRSRRVTTVIVGTCGGTSAVRELINTFGYSRFVSTRSTGRQIMNNAIVVAYIGALLDLEPGGRLTMNEVLSTSLAPYRRAGNDESVREDASFYHLNIANIFAAILFDRHVRGTPVAHAPAVPSVEPARDQSVIRLAWQPLVQARPQSEPRADRRPPAAAPPSPGGGSRNTAFEGFVNQ